MFPRAHSGADGQVTYAANTSVPVDRTRAEIEHTLMRYGATGFAYGMEADRAMVGFQTAERRIRFVLPLVRTKQQSQSHYDQMTRCRWRALLLSIKAKLEAVESGIESFDEAFLSHIVMPNGQTMAEHSLPYIREAYGTGKMPPLLAFSQ
jgi:hypothetical protein